MKFIFWLENGKVRARLTCFHAGSSGTLVVCSFRSPVCRVWGDTGAEIYCILYIYKGSGLSSKETATFHVFHMFCSHWMLGWDEGYSIWLQPHCQMPDQILHTCPSKRFLSPDIPFILLSLSHVIIKVVLACISCLFFMSFGGDAMAESWSNIESNHSW